MRDMPFAPWYASDWLASTARSDLSLPARAIYLDLLFLLWERDGWLPVDAAKLARLTMTTPAEFNAAWPEMKKYFTQYPEQPGMFTNAKMLRTIQQKKARRTANMTAGVAGAAARKSDPEYAAKQSAAGKKGAAVKQANKQAESN